MEGKGEKMCVKVCPNCGKEVGNHDHHCPYCDCELDICQNVEPKKCPECCCLLNIGDKECPQCGTKVERL
jgi:hypothetical protein